jgi:polyketide synthase 12/myxalamid-type polyketide synthase MxaB
MVRRAALPRAVAAGLRALAPDEGLSLLDRLLEARGQVVAVAASWTVLAAQHPAGPLAMLLSEVVGRTAQREAGPGDATLLQDLEQALPRDRRRLLEAFLTGLAGRALGLSSGEGIDPERPLNELGLDSMMAVELRDAVGSALGLSLPATTLLDYPTVASLAAHLAARLPTMPAPGQPADAVDDDGGDRDGLELRQRIAAMSEADAERRLLERLEAAESEGRA